MGIPLGVSDVAVWKPQRVSLPAAFSLLLYTDGIIEGRVNGLVAERIGEARLTAAFVRSTARGRELSNEILLAAKTAHGGPLPDDAALLLLEHQPNAAPANNPVPFSGHGGRGSTGGSEPA